MTLSIFDDPTPAGEPSSRVAFSGNCIDRQSENRAADCLTEAFAHPDAHTFMLAGGGRLVMGAADPDGAVPPGLMKLADLDRFGIAPEAAAETAVLLGFAAGTKVPRIAVICPDAEALPEGFSAVPLRAVYTQALLPRDLLAELAQAASLINWNASAQFCGRCGTRTLGEAGGYRRRCPSEAGGCGAIQFPRTDPVVIMLAIDEASDRCLLGRSPHFAPGMYSCLAGFLEPGETMEDAVRRETEEESGIAVGRVKYHASQPWPLPHTIMIGFYAEATSFLIDADRQELEDCRWFSRAEAARLLERRDGEMMSAPDGAIANLLLRDWVERA